MATVGFLHTADVHVATFGALLAGVDPRLHAVHLVDADLLADARRDGVDDDLRRRLRGRLAELAAQGADVIVCTCSTLSGQAEALSPVPGPPVVRVDRPMAEGAVRRGRRVAVVAALASTLEPTRSLLEQSAQAADVEIILVDVLCLHAWAAFEAGDVAGYLDRIEARVREVAGAGQSGHPVEIRGDEQAGSPVDVVVLAQASMAPVADRVADLGLPVLSSPRLAVEHAVALLPATA